MMSIGTLASHSASAGWFFTNVPGHYEFLIVLLDRFLINLSMNRSSKQISKEKMRGKRFDGISYFFLRRNRNAPTNATATTIAMIATRDMSEGVSDTSSEGMFTVSGSDGVPSPIKFIAIIL